MMDYDNQVSLLLSKYQEIYNETQSPEWAVVNRNDGRKIYPAIPFVGKNYSSSHKKILLYASAENLTYYEEALSKNDLLETEKAWNRRRLSISCNKNTNFPDIHISPVSNGGLLSSLALFIESFKLFEIPEDPYEFIENIAADNLGKYSIRKDGKGSNEDYINRLYMIKPSFPFIKADLEILKPDYIILPKRAFDIKTLKNFIMEHSPTAKIIPVYQLTSTVVNCTIANQFDEEQITLQKKNAPTYIKDWVNKIYIQGMKKDGMFYYFKHVMQAANKANSVDAKSRAAD